MTPGGKLQITATDRAGNTGTSQNTGIVVDAATNAQHLGPDIVNTLADLAIVRKTQAQQAWQMCAHGIAPITAKPECWP